jgi:hypothetical protein
MPFPGPGPVDPVLLGFVATFVMGEATIAQPQRPRAYQLVGTVFEALE